MQRTFSKMGGGSKDDAQWYYIDKDNNYVGPVNTHKLKQLKKFEYVLAESYVWSAHLSGWMLYSTVPDLVDVKAATKQAGAPPSIGLASQSASKAAAPPSLGIAKKQPAVAAAPATAPAPAAPVTPAATATPVMSAAAAAAAAYAAAAAPATYAAPVAAAAAVAGNRVSQELRVREAIAAANAPPSLAGMSIAEEAESASVRAGRVDMLNAPDATDQWNSEDGLRVIDSSRKIRCTINTDGTVADGCGKVLAYIEPNGDVGSAEMDYLGKASNDLVLDRNDQVVGAYDVGRGLVRDSGGSTIAEVSKEGVVLGNSQMQAGWVEGFTFDAMQTLAAYLHLVDPAFTASS